MTLKVKPCVMAVDDDSLFLRYLRRALERGGYSPVTVDDPSDAVEHVRDDHPDLVLLDVRMPGVSGFDLYALIKKVSRVPVIFLSASNRQEDRYRALEMGAAEYMVKPVTPAGLLTAIDAALDDQTSHVTEHRNAG